jgi:hypothetical protein
MSIQQASLLVIIVPPILFVVIAALIRPPWKIIGLALVAGLVVAGLNMAGDALAHHFGWWRYPFTEGSVAPLTFYMASWLFYGAGIVGLVGWWICRRFGWKGAAIFLVAFPFFGLARDFSETSTFKVAQSMIVWGPGFAPYLADFLTWGLAALVGFFTLYLLEKATQKK